MRRVAVRLASLLPFLLPFVLGASEALAQMQTPLTGHYPPGQSGLRGAARPEPGITFTNFNRFFTNVEQAGPSGAPAASIEQELRYANISMITWTSDWAPLGMRYGALAGIPFATGDLSSPNAESGFGLGDVLLTPISLSGGGGQLDYQIQLTFWSASGRFSPGASDNRGTGFWALVYSLGGVWYPGGDRDAWSISAIARFEQNFEQRGSRIDPGDDVVVDWGVGRMFQPGNHAADVGVSGFALWQVTRQVGGSIEAETERYRLFGIGPEASLSLVGALSLRLRAQWELAARNIVRGNNLWIIVNTRF
jgi:hypothetical protein